MLSYGLPLGYGRGTVSHVRKRSGHFNYGSELGTCEMVALLASLGHQPKNNTHLQKQPHLDFRRVRLWSSPRGFAREHLCFFSPTPPRWVVPLAPQYKVQRWRQLKKDTFPHPWAPSVPSSIQFVGIQEAVAAEAGAPGAGGR